MPLVSPVIVQEVAGEITVHVAPPGEAVTVYEVGEPPEDGAMGQILMVVEAPTQWVGLLSH